MEIVVSHLGCPVAPGYQLFCPGNLIFMILIIMTLYLNEVKINNFVWIKVSYCILPGLSLGALKLAFSASGDGWGGHPGDISVSFIFTLYSV